ncbi:uncharacterized protein LOC111886211 [Lactuca sativa]|uniref:uncharacterized protein LOC111886211 n=1 Tax=Lactuca sativa TaxID=4236 RepID=UPI000CD8CBB8|nr:uncharacterized protein LOC111886211 [Lactuca sativa]
MLPTDEKKNQPLVKAYQPSFPFLRRAIPIYEKFMKDLLTNRNKMEEASNVLLNENCSTTMLNKFPKEIWDQGSLTNPCQFGNLATSRAFFDSRDSVNILSGSFFNKLNLLEPRPICMAIHLANKTVSFPGFFVLYTEEDNQVPIILGRPFLSATHALMYIRESKITLVGEDTITFGVGRVMKHSKISDDLVFLKDMFNTLLEKEL